MATPHVTGSAALYLAAHPGSSAAQVTAGLLAAATTGKVTSPGTGSPNLLDFDGVDAPPPPPPASTAPAAPTLSGASAKRAVKLTWTVPADGGSAITGYRLYRSTSAAGPFTLRASVGPSTAYTDSATGGTNYYYRLIAVNAIGDSPVSNTVTVTPRR